MNPDGELLIETGDSAELPADDHHRPFYLPDHLSFGSERILCEVLEKSGYELIEIRKYPFIKWSLDRLIKETAKVFLPRWKTNLKYLFKRYDIDMYIRARSK